MCKHVELSYESQDNKMKTTKCLRPSKNSQILWFFFALSATKVPNNESRFISIRMNGSRNSSLFVVVLVTSSS